LQKINQSTIVVANPASKVTVETKYHCCRQKLMKTIYVGQNQQTPDICYQPPCKDQNCKASKVASYCRTGSIDPYNSTVKEESSQNCSDSEGSSSSQSSSTAEAEDIESDLESLEEHYYSDLRRYSAPCKGWRGIFLHCSLASS